MSRWNFCLVSVSAKEVTAPIPIPTFGVGFGSDTNTEFWSDTSYIQPINLSSALYNYTYRGKYIQGQIHYSLVLGILNA